MDMDNKENVENISSKLITPTKVYYFVDNQTTPYSTVIPLRSSEITLNDFKKHITRRNYKYYCKVMDEALNAEVKAEISDPNELLKPNANGRFELFLLTENIQLQQLETCQPSTKSTVAPIPHFQNNRLFADSNFASSLSDDDSQYTTTDFTSVSQQNPYAHVGGNGKNVGYMIGNQHRNNNAGHQIIGGCFNNKRYDHNNKPCWTREKRKRYRRSPPPSSFLSSTFEDTEISMAFDLITVTFNLNTNRPLGMSIQITETQTFSGIVVHEVTPGGLVALDGRIKPGYILLEINGNHLDDCETINAAVDMLTSIVGDAIKTQGRVQLTCAKSEATGRNVFAPPRSEPVRPIDPATWIHHVHLMNNIPDGAMAIGDYTENNFISNTFSNEKNIPKSATISKINLVDKCKIKQACDQSTSPLKSPFSRNNKGTASTELKLIHNPSADVTTTSGNSSLECSIGNDGITNGTEKQQQKRQKAKKTRNRGGIGSTLRRLVCIPTIRRGGSRKRKACEKGGKEAGGSKK